MIELVTRKTLLSFLARCDFARNGLMNEETESEVMFVIAPTFGGIFLLHTSVALGPVWIGIQNATARAMHRGTSFPSVLTALEWAVSQYPEEVFYTDDAAERLRWMAERVATCYASGQTRWLMEVPPCDRV